MRKIPWGTSELERERLAQAFQKTSIRLTRIELAPSDVKEYGETGAALARMNEFGANRKVIPQARVVERNVMECEDARMNASVRTAGKE